MKTLTVTEVARSFSSVLDTLERDQEEIVLTRNKLTIARLVPEFRSQNALEVLGNLYRTLDDESAESLSKAVNSARNAKGGTLRSLKSPWAF